MIESLLIAVGLIILVIFLQMQTKTSNNSNVQFKTSLDEKIKSIHDEIARNRDESNKNSLENRQELSKTLYQFEEKFGKNIKDVKETIKKRNKQSFYTESDKRIPNFCKVIIPNLNS